jgi:transcriptional regulator with XRE-family HTH domain
MTKKQSKQIVEETPLSTVAAPEDEIGSRIREARESRGLSQTAVATRTKMNDPKGQGISRTVLVGYEAGQTKPGAREIRLLCETLGVTPNVLIYGSELAHESTQQAALDAVRNMTDLVSALRLALAICVLRPHERSAISSLVLSMAGRELGDLKLSALFGLATWMSEPVFAEIRKVLPEDFDENGPLDATLESIMKASAEAGPITNIGNKLRLDEDGKVVGGEWLYPEPKK